MNKQSFLIITAVKNEEKNIEALINGVNAQTRKPEKWLIINDGSTDRTAEIVTEYSKKLNYIELINVKEDEPKPHYASKIYAELVGLREVNLDDYDFLAVLDADISFDSHYYEQMLGHFAADDKLGIAGGMVQDVYDGKVEKGRTYHLNYVSGGIQMFRTSCYRDTGGLIVSRYGGEDTAACVLAQMKGWKVTCFSGYPVLHHRRTGSQFNRSSQYKAAFNHGMNNYVLGYHPLYMLVKSVKRALLSPVLIGSFCMLSGYLSGMIRRENRLMTKEGIAYFRKMQMKTIRKIKFGN